MVLWYIYYSIMYYMDLSILRQQHGLQSILVISLSGLFVGAHRFHAPTFTSGALLLTA
jgi:hypothetical protein